MKRGGPSELSLRALVLGALLSVLLSAANAYLGLFAGMTVSASIPAAVVSMAILRGLRGTILENNLVQTMASAGESAAAGAIFTLPALLLLGAVRHLDYASCSLLVGVGGVLGVLFTIPLRHVLIVEGDLPFPEGVATAEVLTAGHAKNADRGSMGRLVYGALFGAGAKLLSGGFRWAAETAHAGFWIGGGAFSVGLSFSPALAAVGAIVGLPVSLLMMAGGVVNSLVVVPSVSLPSGGLAVEAASAAWASQTRYLGVGAMAFGGLWTLFELRAALRSALRLGRRSLKSGNEQPDLPRSALLSLFSLCALVAFGVLWRLSGSALSSVVLLVLVLLLGFLFCAVAAYMAGLVGSSNNPVSGVTIATVLITSAVLLLLGSLGDSPPVGRFGAAGAILVGTMVCTAAAIGGDNMQDLKAGRLLGANPARQQIGQLVGVLSAALVLVPILNLLARGYGFGAPTPDHPHALGAPQAALMASVAEGVFEGGLPWGFVFGGAVLAAAMAAIDQLLRVRGARFRAPVLAFAVGLYLPLELTASIALGALIAGFGRKGDRARLLMCAGLITGEALLGIGLAVAVACSVSLANFWPFGPPESVWLGAAILGGALFLLVSSGRSTPVD